MNATNLEGFLLTRRWRQTRSGLEYVFWATSSQGPVKTVITDQEAVCFVPRTAKTTEGRRTSVDLAAMEGTPVDALYFPSQAALRGARDRLRLQNIEVYESDLSPADRYLMERFITGPLTIHGEPIQKEGFLEFTNPRLQPSECHPKFKVASIDIETEGFEGQLYSIAIATPDSGQVFMVGTQPNSGIITFHQNEKTLLQAFFNHIQETDPDILIGWNVVDFDLQFLARRCQELNIPFTLARDREPARVLPPRTKRQTMLAQVPGRVVLDGIATLKTAMFSFENFGLEAVAQNLLGKGKLISHDHRDEEITRLFHEDPQKLAAYNLEDCRLVLEIFDHADLINLVIERTRLTGLSLDRQGGSVAAFDFVYLPRLHRQGYVAPDLEENPDALSSPGGYVMDSQPGLYENVLVLDFKSLYPSIIRTFHVDPLALAQPGDNPIPGYQDAKFSREKYILPDIIKSLWKERDKANKQNNKSLSQAIKILMNSFYGVLGTTGCRFFSPQLAGSITRYGKRIITKTREFIEEQGYSVIYGDTDSVFVLLGEGHDEESARNVGRKLSVLLNKWWTGHLMETLNIESFLEIEFETHYLRFLMPTIRGSEKGSKKRYAGLIRKSDGELEVIFKGLETVRSDWTPAAREFQKNLYQKIFLNEPYEGYVKKTVQGLFDGKLDGRLVYRKQLRKPVGEYLKNVPPHAQAARKLEKPGRWISYLITINGPEPVENQTSKLDYHHYLDRQLAPAADSILFFLGTSLKAITDPQMQLF